MATSLITLPSAWGVALRHECTTSEPASGLGVVLFPGDRYRCDAPLLYYARLVALQRGADVLSLEYGHQVARVALSGADDGDRIVGESTEAVDRFVTDHHRRLVFISKSLGTWVAGEVGPRIGRPIVHIFLTPVPGAAAAMRESGGTVLVGSADPVFDGAQLGRIRGVEGLDVRVVPDADHGLVVPTDHRRSLATLGLVAGCCDDVLRAAEAAVAPPPGPGA